MFAVFQRWSEGPLQLARVATQYTEGGQAPVQRHAGWAQVDIA